MSEPTSVAAISRRRVMTMSAAMMLAPTIVRAQTTAPWPGARPITMVVPFGTGGGTDIVMRLLAPKLSAILGQSVIVDNRPGAGSTVGVNHVAKSAPDGYTLVLATLSSTGVAAGLYRNLPYDPVRDLTAIAPTNFVPICHSVTTKGIRVANVAEWIALLKANPGKYSYGSSGAGSTGHLASANFLQRTGTSAEHVPYRSPSQVFNSLVNGEVHFNSDIPSLMLPFHRNGDVKTLFVATDERSPLMPEVPTAAEVGLPGYKAYSWYGIFAPAGLPRPIVDRLAKAIDEVLGEPDIRKRLDDMGTPGMRGFSPERFTQYVKDEIDVWVPIVKASGASAD